MKLEQLLDKLHQEPDNIELIVNIGKAYKQLNDFDNARKYLEWALEKNPHYSQATCSLVHLLMDFGLYTEGITIFKQAMADHKDDEAYRGTLINALFALFLLHKLSLGTGKSPGPVEHNYEEFFFKIGTVFKEENLYEAAIKIFETGYKLSPLNARQAIDLADCYIYEEMYGDAEKVLESLLVNYPEDEEILNNLCEVNIHLKEYDRAIEYAHKLNKLNPENLSNQNILAYGYLKNKEYHLAIEIYQKQINLYPENFEPYKNLFIAYKLAKQTEEARKLASHLVKNKHEYAKRLSKELKEQLKELQNLEDPEQLA
jgi:tetratricopeptide (TPR) repeat protein